MVGWEKREGGGGGGVCCFFFQAEDGIRDWSVTGVQTCALPIWLRGRARGLLESDGKDIWSIELVPGRIQVRLLGNFLRSRLEILDEDGEVVASGGNTVTWEVPQEGRYGISVQGFRPERPYELAVEIDPAGGFEGEALEGVEEEDDFEVRSPASVGSAPRIGRAHV